MVPGEIMRGLGITEFSMELEITPGSKLAREDASAVVRNLEEKGFHLQLPRNASVESIMSNIANPHFTGC